MLLIHITHTCAEHGNDLEGLEQCCYLKTAAAGTRPGQFVKHWGPMNARWTRLDGNGVFLTASPLAPSPLTGHVGEEDDGELWGEAAL